MGPFIALLLASAPGGPPAVEGQPVTPAAKPAETSVSVGLGRVRQGGAMGAGLSLTRGTAIATPAPGKSRLMYRLEVHTTESGFPKWIEARLSLTEDAKAGAKGTELTAPEHQDGAFLAAVACVLRWLQPRDQ